MRSLWTVGYVGPHTATTLKKLERLLNIQALDMTRERYVWDGEHIERAVFYVDHDPQAWPELIVALHQKTSLFAATWQMRGDGVDALSARVTAKNINTQFHDKLPPGLREISWMAHRDQNYSSALLTTGSSIARW